MKLTILCKKALLETLTLDPKGDIDQITANLIQRFPKCHFRKSRPEIHAHQICTDYAIGSHGFCLKCRKLMEGLCERLSSPEDNVNTVTVELLGEIIKEWEESEAPSQPFVCSEGEALVGNYGVYCEVRKRQKATS